MAFPPRISVPTPAGELEERTIAIDRVSRTVKGGKRMRFRALVVVGDRRGRIGAGLGKATEVPLAVEKAARSAKKQLMLVPLRNDTIAHAVTAKFGGTTIELWPATAGTSIIAGGPVRAVIELVGIRNILGKLHGSTNKTNAIRATLAAFEQLAQSQQRRQPVVSRLSSVPQAPLGDPLLDRPLVDQSTPAQEPA